MATASVVLTGHPKARISEPTRMRVRAAAEEIGYRPRAPRSGLRVVEISFGSRSSGDEGIAFLEGVLKAASDSDRATAVLPPVGVGAPRARLQIDPRLRDGSIYVCPDPPETAPVDPECRTVAVDFAPTPPVAAASKSLVVRPDDEEVAEHLARLLARDDRARVAVVALESEASLARQWHDALVRAAQPPHDVTLLRARHEASLGEVLAGALGLPAGLRPAALLCLGEQCASAASAAASAHGLRVPEDLWIGARTTARAKDPASADVIAITLPAEQMGSTAFKLLVATAEPEARQHRSKGRTALVPFEAGQWSVLPQGRIGEAGGPDAPASPDTPTRLGSRELSPKRVQG